MRILFVSFIANTQTGGMGKWTYRISKQLREVGYETKLWFAEDFPDIGRFGRFSKWVFAALLAIRLVRSRASFDIAVIHEPVGLFYAIIRKIWSGLPPMILMCHNVESNVARSIRSATEAGLAIRSAKNQWASRFLHSPLSDGAIRMSDHIVCLSTLDRRYLTSRLGRTVDQVFLMINGVDTDAFDASRQSLESNAVLFVGGWQDVKGRRLLPEIWRRVAALRSDVRLTVAGTGASADTVLAEFPAAARGSVNVIPHVASEFGMAAIYSRHSIFLMPSITEGSPLSLMEAMAAGLPAVATAVGGIPDIIQDGVSGRMFAFGDAQAAATTIVEILSAPPVAKALGKAARQRASELTWMASSRQLESALLAASSRNAGKSSQP